MTKWLLAIVLVLLILVLLPFALPVLAVLVGTLGLTGAAIVAATSTGAATHQWTIADNPSVRRCMAPVTDEPLYMQGDREPACHVRAPDGQPACGDPECGR